MGDTYFDLCTVAVPCFPDLLSNIKTICQHMLSEEKNAVCCSTNHKHHFTEPMVMSKGFVKSQKMSLHGQAGAQRAGISYRTFQTVPCGACAVKLRFNYCIGQGTRAVTPFVAVFRELFDFAAAMHCLIHKIRGIINMIALLLEDFSAESPKSPRFLILVV